MSIKIMSTTINPDNTNRFGHVYGSLKTNEGYGVCSNCGCRENTDEAAATCRNKNKPGEWIVSSQGPSSMAKSIGLKSLKEVSEITGKPIRTLQDWHRDQPKLFRIVLIGCKHSLSS